MKKLTVWKQNGNLGLPHSSLSTPQTSLVPINFTLQTDFAQDFNDFFRFAARTAKTHGAAFVMCFKHDAPRFLGRTLRRFDELLGDFRLIVVVVIVKDDAKSALVVVRPVEARNG